jgi:peptidoglycan hydrolase-like protein with peptidoglycan-binding domain
MLSDLAAHFDNMPDVPVNGNFGSETFEAVKLFQQRVGLFQNGAVNSNTWNMMVRASEHINKMG